jgi:hypothetical protein
MSIGGCFPSGESVNSPVFNAEVKNGGTIPSFPHTSSRRDNYLSTGTNVRFYFYFFNVKVGTCIPMDIHGMCSSLFFIPRLALA